MSSSDDRNDQHVNSHHKGAEDKRAPAADALNEEEQEEQAGHDLDEAEETAEEEGV